MRWRLRDLLLSLVVIVILLLVPSTGSSVAVAGKLDDAMLKFLADSYGDTIAAKRRHRPTRARQKFSKRWGTGGWLSRRPKK
jgi:hypothetical protein